MSSQVDEIKQKIVDGMKILLRDELMELNTGHLSVKVPGENLICMPGHLHDQARTLDTLTFDDIITIDMEGNKVEGELGAVGERFIHTKIYAARPDVASVIHCHPQMATCFSIAGVKILPVYHRAAIFHPAVPIWDYPGQIDRPELGQELAEALGGSPALLVRGHGAVTVGESPEACVAICAILERTAKMQYIASTLGTPRPIEAMYLDGNHIKGQTHKNWVKNIWGYLSHTYLDSK
ncbi:MAG TPA: class II aldolase/adducin family protein [Syntrophorhabdales bacterium]|nr:class II aldolase/adducin family protein [Syntrophorhabdales bacterium]